MVTVLRKSVVIVTVVTYSVVVAKYRKSGVE